MIFVNNLSLKARQELEGLTQHAPGRVAQRAWMVWWSADQVPVPEIARRFHCKQKTVRKWLRRYQQNGAAGLFFVPPCGPPRPAAPGGPPGPLPPVTPPP